MAPSSTSLLQQVLQAFPRNEIVKMRNPENVEKLLSKICEGKAKSLQVVADFDYTLTRYHMNGKRCESSYGVMDHSQRLPEEYRSKCGELYEKYHPIESSHEMSAEEKIPQMTEWYAKTLQAVVDLSGLNVSLLDKIVAESNALLRDHAELFLEKLNNAGVPVLIFSAGLGDVLKKVLSRENSLYPNIKIVSNWLEFDKDGKVSGYKEPVIHTYNKNRSVLGNEKSYFDELSHRANLILLGDSVGDIHMADGMEPQGQGGMLKIGFLSFNIEERLDSFLEAFDIVILDDQSMDFPNILIEILLKKDDAESQGSSE